AVCSNSSYSWSLTRNLICRLSFLFSPINPTSYCSFFNRTSKHLSVFLLSTFYHAFSVVASSIFGTQISLFLLSQKCPLTPIYMGGLRPCLFEKRQPQKLSHIKPPTPESSGAPSPVGRSKKGFFDKPRGNFCECVNSLNSNLMDQQKPFTLSVAIYIYHNPFYVFLQLKSFYLILSLFLNLILSPYYLYYS